MNFFDGKISTSPPDCKTNECNFVPLWHFPKMRQIQFDGFFMGALMRKYFDIIKYSRIMYHWMADFMLNSFSKKTFILKRTVWAI